MTLDDTKGAVNCIRWADDWEVTVGDLISVRGVIKTFREEIEIRVYRVFNQVGYVNS